ncbi:MAG: hypothetical protein HC771_12290 [Synechococcales cyanobacterium CRU_2_2]|nr:hypothetical protein [Synechococcales cyanobacterium CRU_2_2]
MTAIKNNFPQLTSEEYFVWEQQQLERHEYIDGRVYAMSGGSKNHSREHIICSEKNNQP